MTLSQLIRKNGLAKFMTATPTTVATDGVNNIETVANVAIVAVAESSTTQLNSSVEGDRAICELRNLIKTVSTNYGGDDPVFLESYINDVIISYADNLELALECFRDVVRASRVITGVKNAGCKNEK